MDQSSCVVVWEGCVPGARLAQVLHSENVDLASSVLCSGLAGCAAGQESGGFAKGICMASAGEGPGQDVLVAMCGMLKPGATLSIHVQQVGCCVDFCEIDVG